MKNTTITIIGAGDVGLALGKGWSDCGYKILYGVRNTDDPKHADLPTHVADSEVLLIPAAVSRSDVVVLAVPWAAATDAIKACGNLDGKTIIDATNPLAMSNEGLELAVGFTTSGAEELALMAPKAHVVKAMNQVGYSVMSNTGGYASRPVMFIASDNDDHKDKVMKLVADLGFEARDAGPLKSARLLEPFAMLWIDQAMKHESPIDNAFAFLGRSSKESVVEYIRYELTSHTPEELIAAYSEAQKYLRTSDDCLGYQLSQCAESEKSLILRIHWKSASAHLTGFRNSDLFPPFLAIVKPFIDEVSEMRHYSATDVEWFR